MDKLARQLNRSGVVTQGRASIVDTAPESSHLKHWNCIYPSIYIYMCTNEKKKREKYKYCIYYHTYNQSGMLGMRQEGENVRGLTETPLFVHIYTGGCWIYSQSDISETPSLTYYLLYMRIQRHHIHLCEVLSTPHSHLYMVCHFFIVVIPILLSSCCTPPHCSHPVAPHFHPVSSCSQRWLGVLCHLSWSVVSWPGVCHYIT